MKRTFLIVLALIIASASSIFAQTATGRLVGTVSGPDGRIAGATILVTDNQTKQAITITTNGDGSFILPQLQVGSYTVTITAPGFKTFTAADVRIDVGQEYALNPTLEVGGLSENITVTAGADILNSTNAELSDTITQTQLFGLPINGRDPSALIQLQPGVAQGGQIDGIRTSAQNITRDGLNVQDNFIRTGDFNPDRPRIDDVAEFTVVTQNANAALGSGGSSQVQYVTPRGGTEFHGALFEYNQNAALASNDFFNNRNNIAKPPFNQNQFGGRISGPIYLPHFGEGGRSVEPTKKLFFFYEYEGLRLPRTQLQTLPILTPSARQGIFTYRDNSGTLRQFNLLTSQGLTIDPTIARRVLAGLPAVGNNNQVGDQLNTTGFSFNQRADVKLNGSTTRVDYDLNQKNTINFVWKRTTDNFLRPDFDTGGFNTIPFTTQDDVVNLYVVAYTWTPTSRFSNEVRGGYQGANPFFHASGLASDFFIALPTNPDGSTFLGNPETSRVSQGRTTHYYNIQDNATYTRGKHSLRFGGQDNIYRITSFGAPTPPTYILGDTFAQFGFVPANTPNTPSRFIIPGLNDPNQLAAANNLQSVLAGLVTSSSNTFNITSPTSGFVPGAPNNNAFNYDNLSFYVTDQFRVTPRLTLNLGLRYELFTGIKDPKGLRFEVVDPSGVSPAQALLNPNGTFNFVGGNAGNAGQFFKSDKNNFAPDVSFAYSPDFKSKLIRKLFPGGGKTVIRGGYRWTYINDEYVLAADNALQNVAPLNVTTNNLANFISAPPPVPVPVLPTLPASFASIGALSPAGATAFLIDPHLQLPRVEEYNFGIQREIGFKSVLEIRYVGNRSHELIRTVDFNQVDIRNTGFLADFNRARANLLLTGNPQCQTAGCQPLTVFPNLVGQGFLGLPFIQNFLVNGQAGDLAFLYGANGLEGTVPLLPNPNVVVADLLTNGGTTNYNALQVELRRRFAQGFLLQANYTFQKTLTNISPGLVTINTADEQTRVAPFLDNANPHLDYARADYDQTQIFNVNGVWDLPFGKGKRFFNTNSRALDRLVGGFQLGGILRINTGTPLTISDPRGTLNRQNRSQTQTAQTNLTQAQINNLIGLFQQNGNIYYINPSVINAGGFGTNGPGQAPFPGQVFFNNLAGQEGGLGRTTINGPLFTELDMSLTKNIRIRENMRFQIRADVFNVLNHTNFLTGVLSLNATGSSTSTFNINSPTFGQIIDSNNLSGLNRVIQVAGRFEF